MTKKKLNHSPDSNDSDKSLTVGDLVACSYSFNSQIKFVILLTVNHIILIMLVQRI